MIIVRVQGNFCPSEEEFGNRVVSILEQTAATWEPIPLLGGRRTNARAL